MVKRYRKKPVVIEALQYTGQNLKEVAEFCPSLNAEQGPAGIELKIPTLEGDHNVSVGDFVIKGVQGEFYPCKPDIFQKTYEEVTDNE